MRVAVPLGKVKSALVIDTHQNQPTLYDAKEIHQILDERPIVTIVQILHCGLRLIICVQSVMYIVCAISGLLLESETIISENRCFCR
jgi:primosomal protein N' (replication factor Y)